MEISQNILNVFFQILTNQIVTSCLALLLIGNIAYVILKQGDIYTNNDNSVAKQILLGLLFSFYLMLLAVPTFILPILLDIFVIKGEINTGVVALIISSLLCLIAEITIKKKPQY